MLDIKQILLHNGINDDILNHAKKMDINLIKLFKDKVFINPSEQKLEELKNHLMGIYGNYYVTLYYKSMGYVVQNEAPIYENNKEITKADIKLTDDKGKVSYVEVKLVKQILDSKIHYIDDKSTLFIYNYLYRKYEEIGKKLLRQVNKLKSLNNDVTVCVFSDTLIDEEILDKLNDLNVNIKKMGQKVSDIENMIENIILDIKEEYELFNVSKKRLPA